MPALRNLGLRLRSRLAFPALAVAMGLSTLLVGLDHTRYLLEATGTRAAIAAASTTNEIDSTATVAAQPADSVPVASTVAFDTTFQHSTIDSWVHRFTTSLRGEFTQSLTRMDKYSSMITGKLDAHDMPHELIYLAMIESDFNPTAKSKVGAVGMWQFMSTTARSLGLTVKGHTDQRKNPAQETEAALTYLSSLHDQLGSWYLAAAAYNSGASTVQKALMKVTGRTQGTDEDFFRILPELPKETQAYVPKLIAAARVGSAPAQYGIGN